MTELPPLSLVDRAMVLVYLLAMVAVGLAYYRRDHDTDDYLLAGRQLSLGAFVATLVSTWYGGILAVGETGWSSGLVVVSIYAAPYYVSALVFALWLAPKIREAELYTIPDKVAAAYGRPAGLLAATFTWLLANPAPYVLMQATLLQLAFGLTLPAALVIGLVMSTVYVYFGGFRADVRVNVAQFVLMFLGFAVVLPFCFGRLGSLSWLVSQLPPGHLTWHGGNKWQFLLAWWFIAMWTLVEPSFHQRCYAAKTPATARNGVLVSILCWMVFDAMTCTTALYARAALPDLGSAVMAFPALGQKILPPVVLGLFYIGMLATVMSTTVSYTFMAGTTFSRDVVWRLRGERPDERSDRWTILGLLLTSVIALVMVIKWPSVRTLWYNFGTAFIPGLLLPVLSTYWRLPRPPRAWVAWIMAGASGASLAWLLIGMAHLQDGYPVYPFQIEPMYPGLLVSLAGFLLGAAVDRRRPASHPSG
mgnify:CR=1 FL=1